MRFLANGAKTFIVFLRIQKNVESESSEIDLEQPFDLNEK